ncbi:MAG: hypothetical protein MZV70_17625 [Desulfobacterales bacterium]|nr:hypothetical protein [Desulfobacterales bacterium]
MINFCQNHHQLYELPDEDVKIVKERGMNPWMMFVLGIGSAVFLYGAYYFYKKEYFCSTCGKRDHSRASLVKCSVCGKWVCRNNLEKIEEGSVTTQKFIEVTPLGQNKKYPCGVVI